jgi:hypothetical protein
MCAFNLTTSDCHISMQANLKYDSGMHTHVHACIHTNTDCIVRHMEYASESKSACTPQKPKEHVRLRIQKCMYASETKSACTPQKPKCKQADPRQNQACLFVCAKMRQNNHLFPRRQISNTPQTQTTTNKCAPWTA